MRSCRKSSSLILRSWKSSSICDWASSSCCSTVSMWLIELLWGVLLLEMAESLWGQRRERDFNETNRNQMRKSHIVRHQIQQLKSLGEENRRDCSPAKQHRLLLLSSSAISEDVL
jgi:hypothetical protein